MQKHRKHIFLSQPPAPTVALDIDHRASYFALIPAATIRMDF